MATFKPRDYQRQIIRHIITHPRCALFVPMGMGKTGSTLAALETLLTVDADLHRVLVIAPLRVAISTWPDEVRKCAWEGRAAAPDLLVMLSGRHFWIEAKAPGQKPRPAQLREHEIMRRAGGCAVYVCDSPEGFDRLLAEMGAADGNL